MNTTGDPDMNLILALLNCLFCLALLILSAVAMATGEAVTAYISLAGSLLALLFCFAFIYAIEFKS